MRRKISSILFVALISALAFFPSIRTFADDEQPLTIVVGEGGYGTAITRGSIPIEAVYHSSLSTIFVRFLGDLGPVLVEIENQTTGEYIRDFVNTTSGTYPFLISGDAGVYEIVFTLPSGHFYYGTFVIE